MLIRPHLITVHKSSKRARFKTNTCAKCMWRRFGFKGLLRAHTIGHMQPHVWTFSSCDSACSLCSACVWPSWLPWGSPNIAMSYVHNWGAWRRLVHHVAYRCRAGLKTRSNKARKRHKKRCDFDVYFNFIRTDCIYTVQQKGKPEHKVSLYWRGRTVLEACHVFFHKGLEYYLLGHAM